MEKNSEGPFPLWIDLETGRVRLPCGFEFDGGLTQRELNASAFGQSARKFDCGSLPFMHYDIDPGMLEGLRMFGRLSFYAETLLSASVLVSFNKPGATWDDYSLALEAKAKAFHDAYLERLLGRPHSVHRLGISQLAAEEAVLDTSIGYDFAWGRVFSYHDTRAGDTSIAIRYGDRLEKANAAYQKGIRQI